MSNNSKLHPIFEALVNDMLRRYSADPTVPVLTCEEEAMALDLAIKRLESGEAIDHGPSEENSDIDFDRYEEPTGEEN